MTKPKAKYSLRKKPELGPDGWPLVMPSPKPNEFITETFHSGIGWNTGTCRCLLGWMYQAFTGVPQPPYAGAKVLAKRYPALWEFRTTLSKLCKEAMTKRGIDFDGSNDSIPLFNDSFSTPEQRAEVWRKALKVHEYTATVYAEAA